jgi:hypothetical protein
VSPGADDPTRALGLVECFVAVRQHCPNPAARRLAEEALAAVERDGAAVLAEHAFLVLTAVRGWQGGRASRVKASLRDFVEASPR